jgi:hypothetical protein
VKAMAEKMRMKVGITIPVGVPLRALFREASGAVDVRAWANRQALAKAEQWGWEVRPTYLSFTFTMRTYPALVFRTFAFGEEGPIPLSLDDTPLSKPVNIQGLALLALRHFMAEKDGDERITLHLGPSSLGLMNHYLGDAPFPEELELTVTAYDGRDGYTRVKVGVDGAIYVKESWGEPSWWDGWKVSPDGAVEYVGTVDGPRYRPVWLERALEEAKAKGA